MKNLAFDNLAAPYRPELLLHCYRMLGSFQEAEDLVQETLLRAWRGLEQFEGRGSLRSWLYQIATNACLNALAGRARRVLPESAGLPNPQFPPGAPAAEIAWLEPFPDAAFENIADTALGPQARYELREAVELAFVAAIQSLPPRQRAVLLLCDVMGWSAAEAAGLLESSVASANSALQRARATLAKRFAAGQPRPQPAPNDQQRALVERYIQAWECADLDGFAALLKEDAILSMPPWPQWYLGRAAIRAFFFAVWASANYSAFRLITTAANHQPACAVYCRTPAGPEFRAHSIHVFTLHDEAISILTSFINPQLFTAFELPLILKASC